MEKYIYAAESIRRYLKTLSHINLTVREMFRGQLWGILCTALHDREIDPKSYDELIKLTDNISIDLDNIRVIE